MVPQQDDANSQEYKCKPKYCLRRKHTCTQYYISSNGKAKL